MPVTQQPCPQCRGSGQVIRQMASGHQVALRCTACRGTGAVQVQTQDDGTTISEFISRFGGQVWK